MSVRRTKRRKSGIGRMTSKKLSHNYPDLEVYDQAILDRLQEAEGYVNFEDIQRAGQPLELGNPVVPLNLAHHVLDGYLADEFESDVWHEAWADSLRSLASSLLARCERAEQRLDALTPGWREELRRELQAEWDETMKELRAIIEGGGSRPRRRARGRA